ncbi:MAG: hypothetical protein E3K37_12400 [Candidatus Kuenenia sp.]|nr:hypothetical protein [Candidatus Kuenenia hertensis]
MNKAQCLVELIKLELAISDLYMFFSQKCPADRFFWENMAQEEKTHALLLQSNKESILTKKEFANELFVFNKNILREINDSIKNMMLDFGENTLSREEALKTALRTEKTAGELYYQSAMNIRSDDECIKIFQELNKEFANHTQKIQNYMKEKGIKYGIYDAGAI